MFDIKWIRANAEAFDAAVSRRKGISVRASDLLAIDDRRRDIITRLNDAPLAEARPIADRAPVGSPPGPPRPLRDNPIFVLQAEGQRRKRFALRAVGSECGNCRRWQVERQRVARIQIEHPDFAQGTQGGRRRSATVAAIGDER